MKRKPSIFLLSLLFGILIYLLDALIDYLFFYKGPFGGQLFFAVPADEIYMRIIMVAGFLAFGIVISRILAGRHRAEEALKQSEEAAQRLANQTEIIAEIGRIITSTFNIEEVYEGFAEKVNADSF